MIPNLWFELSGQGDIEGKVRQHLEEVQKKGRRIEMTFSPKAYERLLEMVRDSGKVSEQDFLEDLLNKEDFRQQMYKLRKKGKTPFGPHSVH